VSQEIRTILWKNCLLYCCPLFWEGGAECTWNNSSIDDLKLHMSQPHTRDGKPLKREPPMETSILVDHEGKPIVRERLKAEVPAEFQGFRFKDDG
jgi:hypothetical protein